jgi:hypothetical protein
MAHDQIEFNFLHLNESQWRLTLVSFSGTLFQLCIGYLLIKSNQPDKIPSAATVLLFLPAAFSTAYLYFKIFA